MNITSAGTSKLINSSLRYLQNLYKNDILTPQSLSVLFCCINYKLAMGVLLVRKLYGHENVFVSAVEVCVPRARGRPLLLRGREKRGPSFEV